MIVTMDVSVIAQQWVVRDYLPELLGQHARFPTIDRLCELLPNARSEVLPVPQDCEDGFMAAWWARPKAYLDPVVRVATSPWHDLPEPVVDRALARLREDLDSGEWQRRYSTILTREELDVGLRLSSLAVEAGHSGGAAVGGCMSRLSSISEARAPAEHSPAIVRSGSDIIALRPTGLPQQARGSYYRSATSPEVRDLGPSGWVRPTSRS